MFTAAVPELIGGSADLTGSNNTRTKATAVLSADAAGRPPHPFRHPRARDGRRDERHGAAQGRDHPYGGTFLVFSDYCRPAIRLAALMGQRVIFVLTHDSIGLGEDGPTHQPVEHLAALRAIPNLAVFRPADAVETAECWACALVRDDGPSALVLTRQNLPALRTEADDVNRCGARRLRAARRPRAGAPSRCSRPAPRSRSRARRARGSRPTASAAPWSRCPAGSCSSSRTRPIARKFWASGLRIAVEAAAPFGWTRYVRQRGRRRRHDRFRRLGAVTRNCTSTSASRPSGSSSWSAGGCSRRADHDLKEDTP